MDYVSDPAPQGPELELEAPADLSGEMPAEMLAEAAEVGEAPEAPPEMPQKPARAPRVRKVRVVPASPPAMPDHAYWTERLREHRANERAAKNERYGNLRIV